MWEILRKLARLAVCAILAAIGYFVIQLLLRLISELVSAEPPTTCSWLCDFIAALSGISCMECELFAFRSLWLWIILFSLIIVAIIIMVARCVWRAIRGNNDQDEEEPSITIQGQGYLVLVNEAAGLGSPVVTYRAQGVPSGGAFEWTVILGNEKISIEGPLDQQEFRIKAIAPSQVGEDIRIKVKYTTEQGSATDTLALTAHKPESAVEISQERHDFNGPDLFGYEIMVKYRVLNQFSDRFPEQIVNLEETLDVITNPYGTQFISRNYITDENAEYIDEYELTFEGQSVPLDYIAKVRQRVFAEGFQILDQILLYGPTGVTFE
jgi:regulator of RNase E activity RraB